MRYRRIGIIELLLASPPHGFAERVYAKHYVRQYVSIMPQVISVWCTQLGCEVYYDTYYGQSDPLALVPEDLDVVFISAYTRNSPLAYALAKLFKARGCVTVIGGPHAKAFPQDCQRFFDIVVKGCNRGTVADIICGVYPPGSVIDDVPQIAEFPGVEERYPYIRKAAFSGHKPSWLTVVPLLSSIGCPYTCDFCVDWNSKYVHAPADQLIEDLRFISTRLPKAVVVFHDPNFAVKFDTTMKALESISPDRRSRYAMESSLSVLKSHRLARLGETNCVYIIAGVESWQSYSDKSGVGGCTAGAKLAEVVRKLREIAEYVDGVQANMIFGTDNDVGDEPAELTIELMHRLPEIWPTLNVPMPYGGTPLAEYLRRNGRVLGKIPFLFYRNPYLVFRPKNYDAVAYYRQWVKMRQALVSASLLGARLSSRAPFWIRLGYAMRTLLGRSELKAASYQLSLLTDDRDFGAFHSGKSSAVPGWYHHMFESILGRYASLLTVEDRTPLEEA